MGLAEVDAGSDAHALRLFMKSLLLDVRALEQMLADGSIESGVRRIGAEQELVLVDENARPAPLALEVLEDLDDPMFTTELGRFNLEFNLEPLTYGGNCLSALEAQFDGSLQRVRQAANQRQARVLLTGCLPTMQKSDLHLGNMTPLPRYQALNEALLRLRGGNFDLRFSGTDEISISHDSVMLEACNTSCQFHFQVGPDEFARLYNIAQAIAGPVLAAATNSPVLFGRRLWRETRIALFEQAVDTRKPDNQLSERRGRVRFGSGWVKDSVVEILREDVARFRVIMAMHVDENPFEALQAGRAPALKAMQLHNSTVYRWMRPCYGVMNGKPHLRIENRVLPSGPSTADEVANAALWFGLISGLAEQHDDITRVMDFDDAKTNFLAASKFGLDAHFGWVNKRKVAARELVCKELLPLARSGLQASNIDPADIDRYLGIIEARVDSGRTGSQWLLDSLNTMDHGTVNEQMAAIVEATWNRQQTGQPVHEWPLARMSEAGRWQRNYMRVEQYMTRDVFSVHEDEVIDLVASVMDWERIRHVPVEDSDGNLVGLISYRQLLRFLAHDVPRHGDPVPANEIMLPDPLTVEPGVSTIEAIKIMRTEKVACLPVVEGRKLVGIVTEADFLDIAAQVIETQLREAQEESEGRSNST